MNWRLQLEKNFAKRYRKLSKLERKAVDVKLRMLSKNPWHPSLRMKRI